ncbi:MAG: guanylate kinase [Clostridia bacterium]|nr:guanylate kinase [Clostridia bacterium]
MVENKRGLLLVISGPSGVGKGTVCNALLENSDDTVVSVSATTRKPREGEIHGENYYFYTEEKFKEMIAQDELMEWACFCGNYYGTPRTPVLEALKQGKNVILEIEVQGALKVKSKYPEGVFIFVLPPSLEELRNRLEGRGTESKEVVEERLQTAIKEIQQSIKYNYFVVNDTVEQATSDIKTIINAEKARVERCNFKDEF